MCKSSLLPEFSSLFAFALICLGMVLTPGPNMVYMFCVALGITALVMAGAIAVFLGERPLWQVLQRWLMGTVLAGLAVRMLAEGRR